LEQRHMCELTPTRMRSNAVGGGDTSLAWDVAVMSLHRAPPRPQGRRPRGIIWTALGGCRPAERRQGREWRLGVQKPLVAGQGKTVPSAVLLVAVGRSIPGGPSRPLAVRNPGSDGGGRAAPDPGLRRRRCRVGAGLESKGRHLILLVANAQCEVVQGGANDSTGVVVQRLERRYVAVPPHEHRRCAGEVIGQLRQQSGGCGGVVSSRGRFGSTQCPVY
jgi:hypothetical protein